MEKYVIVLNYQIKLPISWVGSSLPYWASVEGRYGVGYTWRTFYLIISALLHNLGDSKRGREDSSYSHKLIHTHLPVEVSVALPTHQPI